jgi:hypothetical protein
MGGFLNGKQTIVIFLLKDLLLVVDAFLWRIILEYAFSLALYLILGDSDGALHLLSFYDAAFKG